MPRYVYGSATPMPFSADVIAAATAEGATEIVELPCTGIVAGYQVIPDPVPSSVTRFQALAALSNAGLLSSVQAAVTASTDPLMALVFNNAATFDIWSPFVVEIATALNLSQDQLNALFIAAAQII